MKTRARVFLSSTVYDLAAERRSIKKYVDRLRTSGGIRFECVASEFPDFPVSLSDAQTRHSYDICLAGVRESDVFVLLLKKRYGFPVIDGGAHKISITEKEYLEARRAGLPVLVFVDSRTWNAKKRSKGPSGQRFVPPKQLELFAFLDRLQGRPENPQPNWMTIYNSLADLKKRLRVTLTTFDDSRFLSDDTVADDTTVTPGSRFVKTWRFMNAGVVEWRGRYLEAENFSTDGLVPERRRLRLPVTRPGGEVKVSVSFRAPMHPGQVISYWKMYASDGSKCFPDKKGLWCRVIVRRSTMGFPR